MLVVSGIVLVLVTWVAAMAVLVAIGMPLSLASHAGHATWSDARRGAWWGLLILAITAYLANLVVPLGSPQALVCVVVLALLGGLTAYLLVRRRGWRGRLSGSLAGVVTTIAAAGAVAYLAAAALGPVSNYDSGLYHLGAIRYASEFATIPGIANIFFPLGYGNAEFPLAALLGNGPWGDQGFRLLNGLVISLMCLDLVVRALSRRRTAGFYVLIVGAATVLVPMVALADYWVTSPSQDSAVFAITLVASAMLVDCVAGHRQWQPNAATAIAGSLLLVLLRPTMVVYLVGVVAVAVAVMFVRRGWQCLSWRRPVVIVILVGGAAAVAATLRDYVLSGWLQYPLSLVPFDVPWRADDPANDRIATLGYHRDPDDLWNAAESWGWVPGWVSRLPTQWESFALLLVAAIAAVLLMLAARKGPLRWRALGLALLPSTIAVVFWWVATPPAFRFAWGPVFGLVAIPLGWAMWLLASGGKESQTRSTWPLLAGVGFAIPVLAVVGFSAVTRFPVEAVTERHSWQLGVAIPYATVPVPLADVGPAGLSGGLVVQVPIGGEQCWESFPLCTPRPDPAVAPRGADVRDGFERRD